MTANFSGWIFRTGLCAMFIMLVGPERLQAQIRGVYPLGMSATNSGVTPAPGFAYSNQFLLYSRDRIEGPDGEVLATGNNSVMLDLNSLVWVSKGEVFGGARYSFSATLPVANLSLTSDATGDISAGAGFGDFYCQPLILGWQGKRAAVRLVYGFLAPTGRFEAGADDNVGSGYWTHVVSSGQTFYLTADKATAVSAFQMYEFHSRQEGTDVVPGETLNLDWSLTRLVPLRQDLKLQVGLAGYGQWQTTDKSGPNITPAQADAHYRVNALGLATNLLVPAWNASLAFKYFQEFSTRSTFQGYSLQFSGVISF